HAQISVLLSEQSLWRLAEQLLSTDTAVKQLLLLDQEQVEQQLPAVEVHGSSLLQPYSIDDPECINSPDDLMVVLYTSGSTGVPKGVALAHRGYVNRFKEQQKLCDLKPGERVAQKTSICFDISVWELLWPLMLGGCVCTVDTATVKNPWKLAEWMERTQIQVMHFVPSLFGEFVAAVDFTKHRFADLRWLVFSGEALPVFYIQQWMDHYGDAVGLANLYGPTEASIDVTAHVIPCCPGPEQSRIPIGKCMDQVHLVVLDEDMKRLPPGEQGELWIGGIQLAQGYLRDPERTAKAFFPNPFPDEIPGKHLYRTGDLVIQLEDGEFDYHGRIDGQVKIRGFRVELGEVEASLTNLSGINEAAVCVMEPVPGQQQLWAWLAGEHCGDSVLRKGLQARLPAYMVPHGFTWMKMLPKNPNGKLDRKQLKWRPASSAPPQDAAPEGDQAQGGFYPLAPAQHWLVSFFEPPYRWAGFSRFRFLKPLHRPCFEQAIRAMQQRHPALRACFQRINGEWQQSFDAVDEPLPIDWIDGRSFDAQQRQQRLAQYINEVEGGLYLDRLPLWRMGLLQEPDGAHTITIVGHHMVNDLVGNGVLFKEMWTAYGQLGGGQEIALGPEPPTIKGYVEHLQSLGDHERKACVDYWRQRFPSR
ncbi:MAG: AMP-binding protein, partial [Gammaproteobacteria bacterium]|nr:AMP-binding protein [Gammaproteobacteria bacterium]